MTERKCGNCCYFLFDTASLSEKNKGCNSGFCAMRHIYTAKTDVALEIKCKYHLFREERK